MQIVEIQLFAFFLCVMTVVAFFLYHFGRRREKLIFEKYLARTGL